MRRLERPQPPDEYTQSVADFVRDYPPASPERTEGKRWKAWRDTCQQAYTAVVRCLQENQGGLCAFCEIPLTPTNHQIEHFIPKSMTTAECDWTINFSNYTLACKGNENSRDRDYSDSPSEAANYTCGHKKDNIDPVGCICNPYDLPPYPLVRADYRDEGLWLVPDTNACQKANIAPALVDSTLKHLGLNCPNLLRRRKEAWDDLLKDIDSVFSDLPAEQQEHALQDLVEEHLYPYQGQLEAFYTTRLLCLASDLPELIQG